MNLFLENIAKHVTLTAAEQEYVMSVTQTAEYKAKEMLLKAGEVCTHSWFVCEGILRSFTIDSNGNEHVVNFACAGWFIADMYSLLSQRPGQLYIEANEPANTIILSKQNQELLYKEVPKMERFFRILVENSLVASQQRVIDNMTFTAEARYDKFIHRYPGLAHAVPQKQIASYIGVTPEFFSKMKSSLLRK